MYFYLEVTNEFLIFQWKRGPFSLDDGCKYLSGCELGPWVSSSCSKHFGDPPTSRYHVRFRLIRHSIFGSLLARIWRCNLPKEKQY
ncbi:hypothetical protein IFM89_004619 [Coptis chinensis]|uniref:Uncharacterized protein n=1 Tax=Coptis chinensis TaxID=261450 RepID=A0A835LEE0_9MAGN|nr:hypothetical protein IFM89_004619 [Coptis chinensis]